MLLPKPAVLSPVPLPLRTAPVLTHCPPPGTGRRAGGSELPTPPPPAARRCLSLCLQRTEFIRLSCDNFQTSRIII